ncbi:MAG: VOC family protein [Myxococcales bacterium]|nr:VOC family protein [Myxococcales bacterium]
MSNTTKTEAKPFNAINWFEIPTRDMDRAVAFYERTLGLALKREVFGGMPHAVFPTQCPEGGHAVSGAIVASAPHLTPGAAGTIIYLDCKDGVAATLARATAAGAKVAVPHMAIGENGFIAVVDDLDGNRIGLHAMTA